MSINHEEHHQNPQNDEKNPFHDQTSTHSHSSKNIIKEGYLIKVSRFMKENRKRWIVLQGIHMYCYKQKNVYSDPTEVFDLTEYNKLEVNENNSDLAQFTLVASSILFRKRLFIASSVDEMNDWIFHIKSVQTTNIKIKVTLEKINSSYIISKRENQDKLTILTDYKSTVLLSDIIDSSLQHIEHKYYPKKYIVQKIGDNSFTSELSILDELDYIPIAIDIYDQAITFWKYEVIKEKGLHLFIDNIYRHKICNAYINCKYMIDNGTGDPECCPIYNSMKNLYVFNEDNLSHLNDYSHFKDEYSEKPDCRYGQQCFAYIRLENGQSNINDRCHSKLFRHPPRADRYIKLQDNVHQFLVNQTTRQNAGLHKKWNSYTHLSAQGHSWDSSLPKEPYSSSRNQLKSLIKEVISNGYESDLCLTEDDEKNHNHSILDVVDAKIKCTRHKSIGAPLNRAQMLALLLYTGCDCNYDLCASQRKGNYNKWKCFDYSLFWAISRLNERETGKYKLYSGLNNVKLDKKQIHDSYFKTYVSATWIKNVALTFVADEGMIIEMEEDVRDNMICCDVSWISRFPDECEILIARSTNFFNQTFDCSISDETNQIQTVSLINKFDQKAKTKAYKEYYNHLHRTPQSDSFPIYAVPI